MMTPQRYHELLALPLDDDSPNTIVHECLEEIASLRATLALDEALLRSGRGRDSER